MKSEELKELAEKTISDHPSKVKSAKPKGGKFQRATIERGANGFSVHAHHDDETAGNDNTVKPMPKPSFFKNKAELIAHLTDAIDE